MTTSGAPVLLTGFEPFGDDGDNPSADAVLALHGSVIDGRRVVAEVLPVTFGDAPQALLAALHAHRPELVIATGLAGGRARLSLERIAVNLIDARIPDNRGGQPIDVAVVDGAPAAYATTLPVKAMLAAAHAAGVPAELSLSAGTFVCNAVFFALMHALAGRGNVRGGFVHVPYAPVQAARHPGAPCLPVDVAAVGLSAMISAALRHTTDLPLPGGSVC